MSYTPWGKYEVIMAFLYGFFDMSFLSTNLIANNKHISHPFSSFGMYSFSVMSFLKLWVDKTSSLTSMDFFDNLQWIILSIAFFTIKILIIIIFVICASFFLPYFISDQSPSFVIMILIWIRLQVITLRYMCDMQSLTWRHGDDHRQNDVKLNRFKGAKTYHE